MKIKICPRCKTNNLYSALICIQCREPLSPETIVDTNGDRLSDERKKLNTTIEATKSDLNEIKTVERHVFFNLEIKFQNRLRYYMATLSILQILFFDLSYPLPAAIGIGLNILVLYFSVSIKRAPNLYFQFIIASFWIVLIFDSWSLFQAVLNQQIISYESVSALLSIGLVIGFSPTLMIYRRSIKEAKA